MGVACASLIVGLVTECCGVYLAPLMRFCPKCGYEARVMDQPVSLDAVDPVGGSGTDGPRAQEDPNLPTAVEARRPAESDAAESLAAKAGERVCQAQGGPPERLAFCNRPAGHFGRHWTHWGDPAYFFDERAPASLPTPKEP